MVAELSYECSCGLAAVAVDEPGRVGINYGVYGVPETYVIDRSGIVRLRYQGPIDQRVWDETFKPLFQQLTSAGAGG